MGNRRADAGRKCRTAWQCRRECEITRKTYSDKVARWCAEFTVTVVCSQLLKLAMRANQGDLGVDFWAFYASMLRCATVLSAAIPRAGVLRRENPHCVAAQVVRFQASAFLQLTWCA